MAKDKEGSWTRASIARSGMASQHPVAVTTAC